jgi:hypothetical protein
MTTRLFAAVLFGGNVQISVSWYANILSFFHRNMETNIFWHVNGIEGPPLNTETGPFASRCSGLFSGVVLRVVRCVRCCALAVEVVWRGDVPPIYFEGYRIN